MNISDIDGYPLTFKFDKEGIEYSPPVVVRDILAKNEKPPEIILVNEGEPIDFLIKMDFIFYAQEINKKEAWAPRQKYRYYIRNIHLLPEPASKIVSKVPRNHQIMIDKANRKLRLLGDMIDPEINSTDWIKF